MVNRIRTQALDNEVYERIYTAGAKPGVLYDLPKVHKENLPIRPIISAFGTYNYNLAKWLDTQQSHFQFLGKFYDQIDGVAMGSPLGPTLANIFMNHLNIDT
jgi:hypothetical protein